MISPWLLYIVLKLYAIAGIIGASGACLLVVAIIHFLMAIDHLKEDWAVASMRKAKRNVMLAVPIIMLAFMVPTPKQAAILYVVPKLATAENVEMLEDEAGELYGLAKEALVELVKGQAETVTETASETLESPGS